MSRPVIIVTGRHRPHELALLAISIPLGLGILFSAPAPQSLHALMPPWFIAAWAFTLAVSGAVGLAAALLPGPILRMLRAEAAAMVMNAGALLVFATAAFIVNGARGWFAVLYFAAWAGANIMRAIQITRDVKPVDRP